MNQLLSLRAGMSSPIDKIFEDIFGYKPKKNGTAFEQLSAIAMHVLEGGEVVHDDKLRGDFSDTLYQLDVHHKSQNSASMGEAKDYSKRKGKVGRGDLQKLGGALPDLQDIDEGTFFSATGYTTPAMKYANKAGDMLGKPITLYGLRPSTELDEQGFIKTIVITMNFIVPHPQEAKWLPHITKNGQESLKALLKEGENSLQYQMQLENFFDSTGNVILSLQDLTSGSYGEIHQDTDNSHACFLLKEHYIEINGVMAEINGLEYELSYGRTTQEMRITDNSEHRFVLLDQNGEVLKFLTDENLREYNFDEDGNLQKR